jgi:hypothetical protein
MMETSNSTTGSQGKSWETVVVIIALILTLLAGAALRLTGVNWDDNQHMHPDERFLSLVWQAIAPVENAGDYFNTDASSLNPANRGYGFFVYGTLPLFMVRYLGEATGQLGYDAITLLGRQVSAIFDVFTILLVFAIGKRLYGKWAGLLAAMFYAFAVLPIQLSHFATVDTITFAYLAVLAAVWALTRPAPLAREGQSKWARLFFELAPYLLFGLALGAAAASKINAVVVAIVLPLVEWVRVRRVAEAEREQALLLALRNLVVAAVVSFLIFRIGQPYAFNGPSFFNMGINSGWWSSLQSLRAQASGSVDFPPALQWARRPLTFSLENLVKWGLGLPLGVLAWLAFIGIVFRLAIRFLGALNALSDADLPCAGALCRVGIGQALVRPRRGAALVPDAQTEVDSDCRHCADRDRSAHDRGLGLCFQPDLYPAPKSGGSERMDLPEHPRRADALGGD